MDNSSKLGAYRSSDVKVPVIRIMFSSTCATVGDLRNDPAFNKMIEIAAAKSHDKVFQYLEPVWEKLGKPSTKGKGDSDAKPQMTLIHSNHSLDSRDDQELDDSYVFTKTDYSTRSYMKMKMRYTDERLKSMLFEWEKFDEAQDAEENVYPSDTEEPEYEEEMKKALKSLNGQSATKTKEVRSKKPQSDDDSESEVEEKEKEKVKAKAKAKEVPVVKKRGTPSGEKKEEAPVAKKIKVKTVEKIEEKKDEGEEEEKEEETKEDEKTPSA